MSVTTEDIAAKVGVSRQVVGKVLSGGTANVRVSAKTEKRIREVARRMGYMPNSAAQAICTGRFNAIGLVQSIDPHRSSSFGGMLESGIQDELTKSETHLIMGPLRDERLVSGSYMPHILTRWSVDGLLVDISMDIPLPLIELIQRHRVPSVWLHSKQMADCVYFDEQTSFRHATEYLLELGHRRIDYLGPAWGHSHYSVGDRRTGYEQAMQEAGLANRVVTFGPSSGVDRLAAAEQIFSGERPTAVVCYSDWEAGHLFAAALRRGVNVPQDLSILAASAYRGNLTGFPFTIMEIPAAEMGRAGVRMLQKKINDPGTALPPLALVAQLVPGSSTVPARTD